MQRAALEIIRRRSAVGRLDLNNVSVQQLLDEVPNDSFTINGHGNNITFTNPNANHHDYDTEAEIEDFLDRRLDDLEMEEDDLLEDLDRVTASLRDTRGSGMALGTSGRTEEVAIAAILADSLRDSRRYAPYASASGGRGGGRDGRRGRTRRGATGADGLAVHLPSPPVPVRMVEPVMDLDRGVDSVGIEVNHLTPLAVYTMSIADGDPGQTRLVGTLNPTGRMVLVHGKLLTFWRYQMTHPNGVYKGWQSIRRAPRFARSAGPLRNKCMGDVLLLAAMVCFAAGRSSYLETVGEAAQPANAIRCCSDLLRIPNVGGDSYDRALVMATNIFRHHNLGEGGEQIDSVNQIMDYQLYNRFNHLKTALTVDGVVSARSDVVGNATDLHGVILPMFLAIDTLLPDAAWRFECQSTKVDVAATERASFNNNIRLYMEKLI